MFCEVPTLQNKFSMRKITETNAKVITEAIEDYIAILESRQEYDIRTQNKVRRMRLALGDLRLKKVDKNSVYS